jgi:hypothetical protein
VKITAQTSVGERCLYEKKSVNLSLKICGIQEELKKYWDTQVSMIDIITAIYNEVSISYDNEYVKNFIMEHINIEYVILGGLYHKYEFTPKTDIGELCLLDDRLPLTGIREVLKKYYNTNVPYSYLLSLIIDLYEEKKDMINISLTR